MIVSLQNATSCCLNLKIRSKTSASAIMKQRYQESKTKQPEQLVAKKVHGTAVEKKQLEYKISTD